MYNSRKCRKSAFTFGPVAQLGERTVRIRKVGSSILLGSTNKKGAVPQGIAFFILVFEDRTREGLALRKTVRCTVF